MYIIHVAPISKGVGKEQLTYFTSKKISIGSIVIVPLRSKKVDALVLGVEDARNSKALLKSSSFKTKKVDKVKSGNLLLPEFIDAVKKTAEYFAGTTGSVLNTLAKTALGETPKTKLTSVVKQKLSQDMKQEVSLVQAEDEDRISIYKGIIREEFAKGSSVFFCLPEISEIERIVKILEKGIEKYTFVFHSDISKKQLSSSWKKVLEEEHPVLIIGTGSYLSIPKSNLKTIILDKESSGNYKMAVRPFIDIRVFAKFLAKGYDARLIFGDILLRPETIYQKEKGFYSEYSPLKFRYLSTANNMAVDMRPDKESFGEKKDVYMSDEFKELIDNAKENSENTFILVTRRGLHTLTVCNDCGESVLCDKCNVPMVLHNANKDKKGNLFICHKCGTKKTAEDKCTSCGSWRLATLGAGIEKVEEFIKEKLANTEILRIDSEKVKTQKKAIEIRDKFYSTPGSVLIGTEMAIPYLNKEISNVVIFSVDSLFSIPDFKIEERIFNILLQLRAHASRNFLIQTRNIEKKIFEFAIKGNLIDFYREEIALRKEMKYPPFSILIKITLNGKKVSIEKEMDKLSKILEEYKPIIFPAFIATIKGKYRLNMLIKIPNEEWIDEKLIETLRSLPMSFTINIEPESVL